MLETCENGVQGVSFAGLRFASTVLQLERELRLRRDSHKAKLKPSNERPLKKVLCCASTSVVLETSVSSHIRK